MRNPITWLAGFVIGWLLAGCAAPPSGAEQRSHLIQRTAPEGFVALDTPLFGLLRQRGTSDTLTVYIEGDGAPWPNPWTPPPDPTPKIPTALQLAAQDPAPLLVYLARPCQYLDASDLAACDLALWTQQRFAPQVIEQYDALLHQLQFQLGTTQLHLTGYSGGGVIAALLTARRSDVTRLHTVAAPLALQSWVQWHKLDPFPAYSDPLHITTPLPKSTHWIGERDSVVPVSVVQEFVQRQGGTVQVVPGYDHVCCWAQHWAQHLSNNQ